MGRVRIISNAELTYRPIVFAIHLLEDQVVDFESALLSEKYEILREDRIRIVTYVAEKDSFFYSNYPINILRNLGIRHVRTSHFILLDMDMWMSSSFLEWVLRSRKLLPNHYELPNWYHEIDSNCYCNSCVFSHRMDNCEWNSWRAGLLYSSPNTIYYGWVDTMRGYPQVFFSEEELVHSCREEVQYVSIYPFLTE